MLTKKRTSCRVGGNNSCKLDFRLLLLRSLQNNIYHKYNMVIKNKACSSLAQPIWLERCNCNKGEVALSESRELQMR
ncbi:MAG TPA: hypothetical protein DDY20_10210 [Desulfobulbaceae bacterium]|nr:hypothetical protein [Desulfobulbaceae bacterium]